MTENLNKLAESLEEATLDNVLEKEVLRNASSIRKALETNGEYSLEDALGNVYQITSKNGHIGLAKH
jgi:uncharacterized protein YheU (UPF0270 family)